MSLSVYNIKKWTKMVTGKSILHVNQPKGKIYSKNLVKGYYNDLTEKVLKGNIKIDELPITTNEKNEKFYFPIAIFQYGLGAYDLFLLTKKEEYKKRFNKAVDWAISNQQKDGGWISFKYNKTENKYSSMAQGEGISLLCRACVQYGTEKYNKAIENAMNCLIRNIDDMGTTLYENDNVYLKEFVDNPVVLNGWIFSIFGLYDYNILFNNTKTKDIYLKTIKTLKNEIIKFDLKYWSKYDIKNKIASPFYHNLHISLLNVLGDITNEQIFLNYSMKFEKYTKKKKNRIKAFIIKAFQKIKEK